LARIHFKQGYFYRAPSLAGYEVIETEFQADGAAGTSSIVRVNCPDGKKALSGGANLVGLGMYLEGGRPINDGSGWEVIFRNSQEYFISSTAWAVCALVD
jgi:hypothetical protein